jgi:hypothetical protein
MRNLLLILILAGMACTALAAEPSLKIDKNDESLIQELRLSPEKYLLKYVSLKVKFVAFKTNLSKEAVASGMKHDTYLGLNVHPVPLDVFMFKKGANLEMKRGTELTLYCRVMKFNTTRNVRYYLLVDRIDSEDKPDEKAGDDGRNVKKSGN